MCQEATHIFVMEPGFASVVPYEHRSKVVVLDVGPDRWSNPYNQELLALVDKLYTDWFDSTAS
jgi:fatty acid/phospholipid biosynthesis enzyme